VTLQSNDNPAEGVLYMAMELGVALVLSPQWTVRLGNSATFSGISTVRL
jgi:phage tail sheath gpL-like